MKKGILNHMAMLTLLVFTGFIIVLPLTGIPEYLQQDARMYECQKKKSIPQSDPTLLLEGLPIQLF